MTIWSLHPSLEQCRSFFSIYVCKLRREWSTWLWRILCTETWQQETACKVWNSTWQSSYNICLQWELMYTTCLSCWNGLRVAILMWRSGVCMYLGDLIQWLHYIFPPLVCRIDSSSVIKVGDFGLAEDMYSYEYFRQRKSGSSVKLPFKWMPLESLQEGLFSQKSDVVSGI